MVLAPAALPASTVVEVRPLLSPASEAVAVPCHASPCAESNSASVGLASAPMAPALAPAHLDSEPLLAVTIATSSTIQHAPCLNYLLTGKKIPTLPPPPATANHLASPLLKTYSELGFPAALCLSWHLDMINATTATGPHASTLALEATDFCQQELLERVQRGFGIILPVDVALLVFGTCVRISCLASVDQAKRKPRQVCDSSAAPDDVTPVVNASTDKYTAPNAIKFGACLPWFLQKIEEADPSDGPLWLSKWISDAFHRCLLRPAYIGAFTYVLHPLPMDTSTLLCIYLILPMGWVNSPDMFCASS